MAASDKLLPPSTAVRVEAIEENPVLELIKVVEGFLEVPLGEVRLGTTVSVFSVQIFDLQSVTVTIVNFVGVDIVTVSSGLSGTVVVTVVKTQ